MTLIHKDSLKGLLSDYLKEIRDIHINQPRLNYIDTSKGLNNSSTIESIQSAFDSWGDFVTQVICYHHKNTNMRVPLFAYMYAQFDTRRMMILNYKLVKDISNKLTLELKENGHEYKLKIDNSVEDTGDHVKDDLKDSKNIKTLYVVVNIEQSEKYNSKSKVIEDDTKVKTKKEGLRESVVYLVVLHRYQNSSTWEFVHVCVMSPDTNTENVEIDGSTHNFMNSKIINKHLRDIITLYDFWTDDTIDNDKKGFPNKEDDKNKFVIKRYSEPHPLIGKNKLSDRKKYISRIILSLPESIAYYMLYRKMLVRKYDEFLVKDEKNKEMIQKIRDTMISHDNDDNMNDASKSIDDTKKNQHIYNVFIKTIIESSKDDTLNDDYTYYIKKWKHAYHIVESKNKNEMRIMDKLHNGKILFAYVSMLQMYHDIEYYLDNYTKYISSNILDEINKTFDMNTIVESTSELPRALVYLVKITENLKNNQENAYQIISDKVKNNMIWSDNMMDNSSRQLRELYDTTASGVKMRKSDEDSESINHTPQSLLEKYKMAPIDSSIYIKNAMVSAAAGVMVAALFT